MQSDIQSYWVVVIQTDTMIWVVFVAFKLGFYHDNLWKEENNRGRQN